MSSRVYVTRHIRDPVPLIEKSRASCPSGRFPLSFIHHVIIITKLNKLYDCTKSKSYPPGADPGFFKGGGGPD